MGDATKYDIVDEIYFLPPLAIARVGGSETPLDSFVWQTDQTIHGVRSTVIRPQLSFEVLADGSLRPYQPNAIQFRDRGLLRPVAPFFELWVKLRKRGCNPLTSALLERLGGSLDSVEYTVTVANRKAQRRTGSAACAYIAWASVVASDHGRKPLQAFSPYSPGQEPLVFKDHPIPLGHFQAIKPIRRSAQNRLEDLKVMNVDLGTLRVRFTPARGEVYGPPTAVAGPASPLPPGMALPAVTLGGRLHEIVPEANRILNPNTPWSCYRMDKRGDDPQPSDSYDGANVGVNRSWGIVDDTCDGIIEAQLVIDNQRFVAAARILSSCPDYAPDRRPFYSVADDLADRDLDPVDANTDDAQHETADLFERAFETASLFNLDAMRERAVNENMSGDPPLANRKLPEIDTRSMTDADRGIEKRDIGRKVPPYADLTADLFHFPSSTTNAHGFQLPYTAAAQFKHAALCDIETLLNFFMARGERVKHLVRPPFGRFWQFPETPPDQPNPSFRDPRVYRDQFHDMRMPPYMRDSDLLPLSVTYRQYDALMRLIEAIQGQQLILGNRLNTPIARRIAELKAREEKMAPELEKMLGKDH
jgi:hypothetical protein